MVLVAVSAFANDGVYFTSGNQLVPLYSTDISVKKEILTISLLDNGCAKVDVYYEFNNPSNTTKTVKMGFEADPPYNDSYEFFPSGVHPNIKKFTVEANGTHLDYKNAVCELSDGIINPDFLDVSKYEYNANYNQLMQKPYKEDDEGISFAYVYYFMMNFKPGKNIVHHTYEYTMSSAVGNRYIVSYKLSPAGRWANRQIDDFTLVIRADKTAKHFAVGSTTFGASKFTVTEGSGKIRTCNNYDTPYYECSLRNGAIALHKTNFRPDSQYELSILSADVFYSFNENARFGEYYDRSYPFVDVFIERKQQISDTFRNRIRKNLPYANRGHIFKDAALKKYFSSLWWYMPDPSYKDDTSDFTEDDWSFVR